MSMQSMGTMTPTSMLSDRNYGFVRRAATLFLPALGALYFALGELWGLPKVNEIVGTIAAVNVFAGAVTSVAQKFYNATGAKFDGTMDVNTDEDGGKKFTLDLKNAPDVLEMKDEVVFKVRRF